jgi:hypothetical protein
MYLNLQETFISPEILSRIESLIESALALMGTLMCPSYKWHDANFDYQSLPPC